MLDVKQFWIVRHEKKKKWCSNVTESEISELKNGVEGDLKKKKNMSSYRLSDVEDIRENTNFTGNRATACSTVLHVSKRFITFITTPIVVTCYTVVVVIRAEFSVDRKLLSLPLFLPPLPTSLPRVPVPFDWFRSSWLSFIMTTLRVPRRYM